MIERIISGGQTGADQAALDVAIRLGIEHGGWIARGRLTENGPLPSKYRLEETGSDDGRDRTEKNVMAADGTLIFSHGDLRGGSAYTLKMAVVHHRPFFHADLRKAAAFETAVGVHAWLRDNAVSVLNVAGPRASEDTAIYRAVTDVLETVYYMLMMESGLPQPAGTGLASMIRIPETVEQAVVRLARSLSFREKAKLARTGGKEAALGHPELLSRIRNEFRLPMGNEALLESCRKAAGLPNLQPDEAELVIVRSLMERLRRSHGLRIIK